MCVCVCACVCVRACVCVCACVRACVCGLVWTASCKLISKYGSDLKRKLQTKGLSLKIKAGVFHL